MSTVATAAIIVLGSTIIAGHMRAEVVRLLEEEHRWVSVADVQEEGSALFLRQPGPAILCMAASDYEAPERQPYWATSPVAYRQACTGSHPRYRHTRCS